MPIEAYIGYGIGIITIIKEFYAFYRNKRKDKIDIVKEYEQLVDDLGSSNIKLRIQISSFRENILTKDKLIFNLQTIANEFEEHKKTCSDFIKNRKKK
jgi:hypothetical protein